jgi:hypothetical protein
VVGTNHEGEGRSKTRKRSTINQFFQVFFIGKNANDFEKRNNSRKKKKKGKWSIVSIPAESVDRFKKLSKIEQIKWTKERNKKKTHIKH